MGKSYKINDKCEQSSKSKKAKAKEWFKNNWKAIAGGAITVILTAISIMANSDTDEESHNEGGSFLDNWNGECSNCGNTDSDSLFDEGDTVYCSKCCHRTRKDDNEDDLVLCPVCHHWRDRKAYCCMWCNSTLDDTEYDPEEDELANEFQSTITDDNLRYKKFKK